MSCDDDTTAVDAGPDMHGAALRAGDRVEALRGPGRQRWRDGVVRAVRAADGDVFFTVAYDDDGAEERGIMRMFLRRRGGAAAGDGDGADGGANDGVPFDEAPPPPRRRANARQAPQQPQPRQGPPAEPPAALERHFWRLAAVCGCSPLARALVRTLAPPLLLVLFAWLAPQRTASVCASLRLPRPLAQAWARAEQPRRAANHTEAWDLGYAHGQLALAAETAAAAVSAGGSLGNGSALLRAAVEAAAAALSPQQSGGSISNGSNSSSSGPVGAEALLAALHAAREATAAAIAPTSSISLKTLMLMSFGVAVVIVIAVVALANVPEYVIRDFIDHSVRRAALFGGRFWRSAGEHVWRPLLCVAAACVIQSAADEALSATVRAAALLLTAGLVSFVFIVDLESLARDHFPYASNDALHTIGAAYVPLLTAPLVVASSSGMLGLVAAAGLFLCVMGAVEMMHSAGVPGFRRHDALCETLGLHNDLVGRRAAAGAALLLLHVAAKANARLAAAAQPFFLGLWALGAIQLFINQLVRASFIRAFHGIRDQHIAVFPTILAACAVIGVVAPRMAALTNAALTFAFLHAAEFLVVHVRRSWGNGRSALVAALLAAAGAGLVYALPGGVEPLLVRFAGRA